MYEFDTLNYFRYYSTLDVDFDDVVNPNDLACTKEKKNRIKYKMMQCKNLLGCVIEPSNKKGYHFRFYCSIHCDKCRLVFDDVIRFSADSTRKKQFTEII